MKMLPEQMRQNKYNSLIKRLAEIIHSARVTAVRQINKAQALAYYEIGREIVEFEQKGKARAGYGEELIIRLSKDMTEKFGKGFSKSSLFLMRQFYLEYSGKFQTVSGKSSIRQGKGNIGTLPVLLFLLLGTTSFLGDIASHLLTAFRDNRNIFKNRAMLSQKILELAFHLHDDLTG